MFLMLTKAPLDEDSKNSNSVNYFIFNFFIYF